MNETTVKYATSSTEELIEEAATLVPGLFEKLGDEESEEQRHEILRQEVEPFFTALVSRLQGKIESERAWSRRD